MLTIDEFNAAIQSALENAHGQRAEMMAIGKRLADTILTLEKLQAEVRKLQPHAQPTE